MLQTVNKALRRVPTWVVYGAGGVLVLWLVWLVVSGDIGPDPVKSLERRLGLLGLQFLIATLSITPLRWLGLNLIKFRRALGLLAFGFITLHFVTWIGLDMALGWRQIVDAILKRPYILIGFLAFLAMVPLALTSTNAAIRRMGPQAWSRLHKLVYAIGLAGAVHYLLLVKVISTKPLLYFAAVVVLLAWRAIRSRQRRLQLA